MPTLPRQARSTTRTTAADPRWARVLARDVSADGEFWYAVKTTGVFCRPSCPSRPARPENVTFHATPADARVAGYRPCKRCRPEAPADLRQPQAARVAEACRLISAAGDKPRLETLAAQVGMSPFHFHRVFKATLGITPRAYAEAVRAERLRGQLAAGADVLTAALEAGFNSTSRLYDKAGSFLGMSPSNYRAGGTHMEIRYALGACSLGQFLVACTDRGICAILLGDTQKELKEELTARFPKAHKLAADSVLESVVREVAKLIETPAAGLGLPLDVRGTAFQQRVWEHLRRIPSGTTTTYTELARAIGAPAAVRAVASACAANPVAIAIPCHRVIRQDGELAGYRWGLARKQRLLARERGQ